MGGTVDALLYLDGKKKAWFDLAIAVHNQGLFCVRVFHDQLRFQDNDEKNDKRERFVAHLWKQIQRQGKELLKRWLASSDQLSKLYAVTALTYNPSRELIELFVPEQNLLYGLDGNTTAYLAHFLQRKIRYIVEHPDRSGIQHEHLRHYMELLLTMALGPYHARVAVRDMEGWLAMLKDRLSQRKEVADILSRLMKESPNTKHLMRKLAKDAHQAMQSGAEEKVMEKVGLILGIEKHLETERLFNELVMLPEEEAGRVDSVASIDLNRTPYVQSYSCRGQNKLDSLIGCKKMCLWLNRVRSGVIPWAMRRINIHPYDPWFPSKGNCC